MVTPAALFRTERLFIIFGYSIIGISIFSFFSFQSSTVKSPEDSSEKISPRLNVGIGIERAAQCLSEAFHITVFKNDCQLEFRFSGGREQHNGAVAHLSTIVRTNQRERDCTWCTLRFSRIIIEFAVNVGDAYGHTVYTGT